MRIYTKQEPPKVKRGKGRQRGRHDGRKAIHSIASFFMTGICCRLFVTICAPRDIMSRVSRPVAYRVLHTHFCHSTHIGTETFTLRECEGTWTKVTIVARALVCVCVQSEVLSYIKFFFPARSRHLNIAT